MMPVFGRDQLQDLIDNPNESLSVEYKSSLDLTDNKARADFARHIAALANHGGGAIVFGITDQMLPHGGRAMLLTRDIISGIVKGTYYLRKPGPASEPIFTSGEWTPVIRRCAMHERAAILGAVDAALRGTTTTAPDEPVILQRWHDAAHGAFLV